MLVKTKMIPLPPNHPLCSPELPIPKLATASELRDSVMRLVRETVPTELGYSFEDLQQLDDITVTLAPEKKGMVFKYVEYVVESRVREGGRVVGREE